jgi:hypothetical protein
MPYQYAHLIKLTPNELHNRLSKRDLPAATIERIKAVVTQQKAALKSERAKAIKVKAEWQPLREGLRAERESLRSMKNYAQKKSGHSDPEVITALEGYGLVLDKLHEEFTDHVRNNQTPAVLARQRNLPNGGIHWSDWVKDKFKERIQALFAAIPPKPHARTKTPFARTTTAKSNDRLRERLRTRTLKEHGIAEQDNQLNPTERNKAKLSKLAEALRRIDKLDLNDPVPRTWSGLFVEEQNG